MHDEVWFQVVIVFHGRDAGNERNVGLSIDCSCQMKVKTRGHGCPMNTKCMEVMNRESRWKIRNGLVCSLCQKSTMMIKGLTVITISLVVMMFSLSLLKLIERPHLTNSLK